MQGVNFNNNHPRSIGQNKGEGKMKTSEYTLEPETAQERDDIGALKLAVEHHAYGMYSAFFALGQMIKEANQSDIDYTQGKLDGVDTDAFGRDANGIDIQGALRALEYVKAIQ
jgi:hypothetical protein